MEAWSEATARLWSPDTPLASSFGGAPLWVMQSDRPGDNALARAVATASGLPFELHHAVPEGGTRANKLRRQFDPSLLDLSASSVFEPPWPDVIVAAGQWAVAVALWVRQLSHERTKVVVVGRPKAGLFDHLALIVASLPYVLPRHTKIIELDFPPCGTAESRLAVAPSPSNTSGRHPVTAVLVGGRTSPFRFGRAEAMRLGTDIARVAQEDGGAVIVLTSPRTDATITEALRATLPDSATLVEWSREATTHTAYRDVLRSADRFIVTGDSASMLLDVASLGRPLTIYPLPRADGIAGRMVAKIRLALMVRRPRWLARPLRACVLFLHRKGLLGFPRSIERLHDRLVERGLAVHFGQPFPAASSGFRVDLRHVGARIRGLVKPAEPPAAVAVTQGPNYLASSEGSANA